MKEARNIEKRRKGQLRKPQGIKKKLFLRHSHALSGCGGGGGGGGGGVGGGVEVLRGGGGGGGWWGGLGGVGVVTSFLS